MARCRQLHVNKAGNSVDDRQKALLTLCALRHEGSGLPWNLLAREVTKHGDPMDMLDPNRILERSREGDRARWFMSHIRGDAEAVDAARERVVREMEAAADVGAELLTVFDLDYPLTLRQVPDRPPFIFVRGKIRHADLRSVAVVGTRDVSDMGWRRAQKIARGLAAEGVTVISGLARGVDTAAHEATLEVGGRTIAVVGTGVTKCYPAENRELADEIADVGAIVSQFWPTQGPSRGGFPRRNRTMSGLAQGTCVIEASQTSGAKMQARIALEHGKRVWLVRSLVDGEGAQEWARKYAEERGACVIESVEQVVRDLLDADAMSPLGSQLTLDAL